MDKIQLDDSSQLNLNLNMATNRSFSVMSNPTFTIDEDATENIACSSASDNNSSSNHPATDLNSIDPNTMTDSISPYHINRRTLPTQQKQALPKTVDFFSGISVTIGTIIGTGIFMSPKTIIENVNSIGVSLIIWILCGIYALCGGLSYLELGLMIKKSGAEYSYLTYTFGNIMGYLLIFINFFILRPVSASIVAITFSNYITSNYHNFFNSQSHNESSILGSSASLSESSLSSNSSDENFETSEYEASHMTKLMFSLGLVWSSCMVNIVSTKLTLREFERHSCLILCLGRSRGFQGLTSFRIVYQIPFLLYEYNICIYTLNYFYVY